MKRYIILLLIISALGVVGCTKTFEDINKNPNAITASEASARYFITVPQFKLFAPDRYPYWRIHLIHCDRFAGHFLFGHNYSWWNDELGYSYNSAYTDAGWGFLAGYFGQLDNFLKLTAAGGEFENEYMYAVGLIMKGMYYQMYTDVFGEIPYSEAGDPDILLPKFDTQLDIYKGIIADLDAAMATIGNATRTGDGVADLGENDIYCGGDLQQWKRMANTLKLRIAMRAMGAPGNDFSADAISQALAAPLLSGPGDNILMEKDNIISQWTSAAYSDVWQNFGDAAGWTLGKELVDYMRDNNDPRLPKYAKPAKGGTFTFVRPASGSDYDLFPKRVDFIEQTLTDAGAVVTRVDDGDNVTLGIEGNKYYIGQPVRLNGFIRPLVRMEFFCTPADVIYAKKGTGQKIREELVMSSAEASFLKTEAIVRNLTGGNAQEEFAAGITSAMKLWNVADGAIATYLAEADLADITAGTTDEKLEKIAVQRWIAAYTDGFEAWAIVRKTGYPASLAAGVTDFDIYGPGDINGVYPERLRYGSSAYSQNGDNLNAAIGRQGADAMDTKLWFSKP
ncbi:MAG: SusD/RagB family nutrient-binding outer membrane lipoprotein [Bacteroidales bacterium]|nr:SusD/RagB family nutrient-binding outer membrane lipoprotein [Bacteroidales bacterium]MDT8372864.1 SusD/RagB family nutrient-binding outer membrane lipoprotein [Bacteroidales bacterium]